MKLDVDVPAGNDAVVLLERDGVYSWHLPVDAGRAHPVDRPRPAHRVASSSPCSPAPPAGHRAAPVARRRRPRPRAARRPRPRRRPGDHLALRRARHRRQGHREAGVGRAHRAGPRDGWDARRRGSPSDARGGGPARPTVRRGSCSSSTARSRRRPVPSALSPSRPGRRASSHTLVSAYDAVIGFDHRTLSVDPERNARDLLACCGRPSPTASSSSTSSPTAVAAWSPGRSWSPCCPRSGWPARSTRSSSSPATNGGTHLADPERWHDLVDLYTNLVMVAAAGLSAVPGGAPFAAVVGGVVRGIGALVKYLVSYAAGDDGVPGLAAMMPGGPFVTSLNENQPGQPGPGDELVRRLVRLPRLALRRPPQPAGVPARARGQARRGLRRRDLQRATTTSSSTPTRCRPSGCPTGGFVRDTFALGTNDVVYHVNYFSQLAGHRAIAQWLPLGLGASDDEAQPARVDDRGAASAEATPGDRGSRWPTSRRHRRPRPARRSDARRGRRQPSEPPAAADEPAAAARPSRLRRPSRRRRSSPRRCRRPSTPGADFTVRVRLSRDELAPTEGTVHVGQDGPRRRRATDHACRSTPRTTCRSLEHRRKVFGLPSGDWASELTFRARALEAGPVVRVGGAAPGLGARRRRSTLEATAAAAATAGAPAPSRRRCTPASTRPSSTACRASTSSRAGASRGSGSTATRCGSCPASRSGSSSRRRSSAATSSCATRIAEVERVIKDPDLTPRAAAGAAAEHRHHALRPVLPRGHAGLPLGAPRPRARPHRLHRRAVRAVGARAPQAARGQARHHAALPRLRAGSCAGSSAASRRSEIRVRRGHARSICPDYANPMFKNDVGPGRGRLPRGPLRRQGR